jgi:hypothetical protein
MIDYYANLIKLLQFEVLEYVWYSQNNKVGVTTFQLTFNSNLNKFIILALVRIGNDQKVFTKIL